MTVASISQQTPLVVDLDGSLIRSDLLVESYLSYVRRSPEKAINPFIWLVRGKAYLKGRLALASEIDPECLPYNEEVLALINSAKVEGRRVVLATGEVTTLAGSGRPWEGGGDESP